MGLSDAMYGLIPFANGLGNVLLKLSVERRKAGSMRAFVVMQLGGYGTFVGVIWFSYLFLIDHDASMFVLVFALNYLATLYMARWLLRETFYLRDVAFDALVVAGSVIFYLGRG